MPHFVFVGIPIVVPCLWLIASEFLALWNHRLWFWLLDYYFFLRHTNTHLKCYISKFPCPGNPDHASFCFCWDSDNCSLTLAYSFRISCFRKSSSSDVDFLIIMSFLRHTDTHPKCSVSKFPCPGNTVHASFCFCWDSNSVSVPLAYSLCLVCHMWCMV